AARACRTPRPASRRGSPPRRPPGRHRRSPATVPLPPPAALSRRTSPPRAPRRAPFFALPHGGRIRAGRRPGLADLLVHLDDLLHGRRELRMPGHLAAHLLHLRRRELAADRLPAARRPGPQEPRPVPGMIRGRARAVRPAALAPVLAHRSP